MDGEKNAIAGSGQIVTPEVHIAISDKMKLLQLLNENSIKLNGYAEMLLIYSSFTIPPEGSIYTVVEVTVESLGFYQGASLSEILEQAKASGYGLCPLGLAPFFRLTYMEQKEVEEETDKQHRAPVGSITIASLPLSNDVDFPKGFYIRKMNGELWLRGYICDDQHIWSKEDTFLFQAKGLEAAAQR